MQQPDADGFVNITWPSKNIPHGGVFHTRIPNPTEDQQKFLKLLLEESKLTLTQNQKNAWALRQQDEKKPEYQPPPRPMVRPRTSRRRSLSEIRQSDAFERDRFRPKQGQDREQMKEKLANMMTYGDTDEQPKPKVVPRSKSKELKLPSNKEKWNELITQIRERTEWLAEMEYLGHAAPHRDIIKDQIAERMRALDALGLDNECGSTRSTASGFSTTRSRELVVQQGSGPHSAHSSTRTNNSAKKKAVRGSGAGRPKQKEENVTSYAQLSPLQRSPRRRQ